MTTLFDEWENLDLKKIHRGQHLCVGRKGNLYYHHGIVVTRDDLAHIPKAFFSDGCDVESLMIIEQNLRGLQIVTLSEFQGPPTRHGPSPIHRARYAVSSEIYHASVS